MKNRREKIEALVRTFKPVVEGLAWVSREFIRRALQVASWVAIGFVAIQFGLPLLGDIVVSMFQEFKTYFIDAPAAEKGFLAFFGLF